MQLRQEIERFITEFIANYTRSNHLHTVLGSPIIGFADAHSDYFNTIRSIAHPNHALPQDILANANLVISYYIPFTKELAKSNEDIESCTDKGSGFEYCSDKWARAYIELNTLMTELNTELVNYIQSKGFEAAVPTKATAFDKNIIMARWSQRHIAYAAGLGTFGMNNMLISSKGCCGRYNSIVTAIPISLITPDVPFTEERCLFKKKGSCGVCMQRCPVQVLKPDPNNEKAPAFNRVACYESCLKNDAKYPGADVCGKCVTSAVCAFL